MPLITKPAAPTIETLTDLFSLLDQSRPRHGNVSLYRGHAVDGHRVMPSLFRKKEHRRVERNILRELIAIQPNEFKEDRTAFDQLVRMQHYGLPTRLLDLTYNPLVALYFSCLSDYENDGELIQFELDRSHIKYFDSDTVSCVANLAHLSGSERDMIRSFTDSADLKESEVGLRLLHFINAEKPYFLPKIVLSDLKRVLAVRPKQANQRILAQQGAFLLFGLVSTLRAENEFGINIVRTKVPVRAKKYLLDELDSININASTLFPEIESAAKYIMSKIPPMTEQYEEAD